MAVKHLIILVLLLFPAISSAQKILPDNPKPNHNIFFIGVSVLAIAKTADAVSTEELLNRGGWENDPVFGKHPSPTRLAGANLSIFAAEAAAFRFTEQSRHRWIRWAGRAYIGLAVEEHFRLAVCNSSIDVHSPVAHNCRSPFLF